MVCFVMEIILKELIRDASILQDRAIEWDVRGNQETSTKLRVLPHQKKVNLILVFCFKHDNDEYDKKKEISLCACRSPAFRRLPGITRRTLCPRMQGIYQEKVSCTRC